MLADGRFGSKADMTALSRDVRYTPNSGHQVAVFDVRFVPIADISAASFDHLVGAAEQRNRKG